MQILEKEEQIFGRRFLEASAGTGKTFAIEHLFVRLLLEGEKPLNVEEILVVTFTKAAARELKERIHLAIQNALWQLKAKKNCSLPYLMPFLDKPEQARVALKEALALFDDASIFTIHSFCFSILKRFAFSADVSFHFQEKENTFRFLKEKALDYFYYYLQKQDYSPTQIELLIKKPGSLEALVSQLINSKEKSSPPQVKSNFQQILEQVNRQLNSYLSSLENLKNSFSEKSLSEEIEQLLPLYKKTGFDLELLKTELSLIFKILKQQSCSFEELDTLGETKLLCLKFFHPSNQKQKTEIEQSHFTFFEIYSFLETNLTPLFQEAFELKNLFPKLAWDLNTWLKNQLKKEELFTYDDLLEQMNEALKKPFFKEKVNSLYRAAIVDEFQDTDPLQWKILSQLFLDHPQLAAFYLVGDPKQSIYSFRKADLYTYFQAKECFGPEAFSTLDTNYRSNKTLMEALNALFSEKFAAQWLKLPKLNQTLPYLEIKAGKEKEALQLDQKASIHFLLAEKDQNKNKDKNSNDQKNNSTNEVEEALLLPYLEKEIIHLQKEVELDEIAILVKDRFQAERIFSFLEKKQVPVHYKSQKSLSQSKALLPLKELLEAVNCFTDLNALKKVLLGKYFQYPPEALTEDVLNEFIELFAEWQEIFEQKGLSIFFNHFLKAPLPLHHQKTILAQLVSVRDLSFYQETMQLIHFLIEEADGSSLKNSSELLEKLPFLEPQDDGRLFLKPQSYEKAVSIMTMHMSKGLEFSVVFAFGLMARTPAAEAEAEAEKSRQLYVTLTRASQRLYVPLILENQNKYQSKNKANNSNTVSSVKEGTASPLELFLGLVQSNQYLGTKSFIENKLEPLKEKGLASYEWILLPDPKERVKSFQIDPPQLIPPLVLPEIKQKGKIFSFSALQQMEKSFEKPAQTNPEFIFSAEKLIPGIDFGLLMHSLLEDLFSGFFGHFADRSVLQKLLDQKLKGSYFLEKKAILEEMLWRTINVPLTAQAWSLKDVSLDRIKTECEFLYALDNSSDLMKGFIDLLFEHEGKIYLLDWKSNYLGDEIADYAPEKLQQELASKDYFKQAAIYVEALKKHFPEKEFEQKFGGVFYLFLRGLDLQKRGFGIYHFYPDLQALKNNQNKPKKQT